MLKTKLLSLVVAAVMLLSMTTVLADTGTVEIIDLTTNYLTNPLGVELDVLRFGWKMDSDTVGMAQSAYQITVTDPDGTVLWDSGVVESDLSVAISYEGEELALETRYDWTVAVTATDGNVYEATAYFETGADFSDVQWITSKGWSQFVTTTTANENYVAETDEEESETEEVTLDATGGGDWAGGGDWGVSGRSGTDTTSANVSTTETEGANAPRFRTEQALTGDTVASARLYITALGSYEAYINGVEVQGESNSIMAPGWTDYVDYTYYQTYDVTDYIEGDTIVFSAIVGAGWYENMSSNAAEAIGNDELKERCLLAKLVITYEDGTEQVIVTDEENWVSSDYSQILAGGIQVTEEYSGIIEKEIEGWNELGYDVSDWDEVVALNYEGDLVSSSASVAYEIAELPMLTAYSYDPDEVVTAEEGSEYTYGEMDPEYMSNYVAGDVIELKAGDILVIDFGQNAAAVPEITFSGAEGTTVTLTPCEAYSQGLTEDYPKWAIWEGAATGKTWNYIMNGDGEETYKSQSQFVGFRYLAVQADADITVYSATSYPVSSISDETGLIETSSDLLNQFISNAKWSQLSNFVSVPTDCPTREYNGWLGDIQCFIETGLYQYDIAAFIDNWDSIMQRGLDQIGTYNQTMPTSGSATAEMGWSDAGIIVPYAYYMHTGDLTYVEKYWAEMSTYVDDLNDSTSFDPYTSPYSGMGWGDHHGNYMPYNTFLEYIFIYYDNTLMYEMAEAMGYEEDAAKYKAVADMVREEIVTKYLTEDGDVLCASADDMLNETSREYVYVDNAETALLWMIKLGLYDTDEQLAGLVANLSEVTNNEDGLIRDGFGEDTIATGFLGVNILLPILSEAGLVEDAFDLMMNTDQTTFLYATANADATTIWERWVLWNDEEGFTSSDSHNHYAYGVANEWLFEYVLGIQKDSETPGFKHFILQPEVDDSLDYAVGSYESYYGTIVSEWYAEDGVLTSYLAGVPANTTATLYLPYAADEVQSVDGAEYIGIEEHNGIECTVFELESGSFAFTVADGVVTVSYAD